MFSVVVKSKISSAHFLREYKGKCENLHGHNYLIEVKINSGKLNKEGMVVDFALLKALLKEILIKIDHHLINEIDFFKINNPTSENIALYIFLELKKRLEKDLTLEKVRIWETDEQYAEYYEND